MVDIQPICIGNKNLKKQTNPVLYPKHCDRQLCLETQEWGKTKCHSSHPLLGPPSLKARVQSLAKLGHGSVPGWLPLPHLESVMCS